MIRNILLIALVATAMGRPEESTKVESTLKQTLAAGNTANIFVKMVQGTSSVLQAISETRFPTRDDRLNALGAALKENAESSQAKVKTLLDSHQNTYTPLWITNEIYVRDADMELVNALAQQPEVSMMTEEVILMLDDTVPEGPIFSRARDEPEWGVAKIQAIEARELLQSHLNASAAAPEIRVSTIDTGVRVTHEALAENYLGDFGWFDPYVKTEGPNDQNGHGTHTTGTIAGKGGIGVFPEAKWIACKGCATSSCAQSALLACGQFITCPTNFDGTVENCAKAPHVVSNSWGGGRGNTWFDGVINAWQVAGIIPLFSIGNSGPSCNTANSPGDRPGVIGVGSTTSADAISSFSSVGPTTDGRMKPEISAPGSSVVSAYHTADDAYATLSGTSMACPHAAGLVAILKTFKEDLVYGDVQKLLETGSETEPLESSGKVCSDLGDGVFPNNVYGSGRINALRSLQTAISSSRK